jgi:hypothetical protein
MYYPKSQIKTNLYTDGGKFIIESTGDDYIGYYWETSKGEYFTGKTPQDSIVQKLILNPPTSINQATLSKSYSTIYPYIDPEGPINAYSDEEIFKYNNFSILREYLNAKDYPEEELEKQIAIPYFAFNKPTEEDYKNGTFVRYFCKKANEFIYIEISKEIFDKLSNKDPDIDWYLYVPFQINWKLTGSEQSVYNTNKNIVELTMKKNKLPQFDNYLKKDYLKFAQYL